MIDQFDVVIPYGLPEGLKKGKYRIEGYVENWNGGNVQVTDVPFSIPVEGDEIKRQHIDKLDIMADGKMILSVEVIENFVFSIPIIIYALIGSGLLTGGIIAIDKIGDTAEQAEGFVHETAGLAKEVVIGLVVALIGYIALKYMKK